MEENTAKFLEKTNRILKSTAQKQTEEFKLIAGLAEKFEQLASAIDNLGKDLQEVKSICLSQYSTNDADFHLKQFGRGNTSFSHEKIFPLNISTSPKYSAKDGSKVSLENSPEITSSQAQAEPSDHLCETLSKELGAQDLKDMHVQDLGELVRHAVFELRDRDNFMPIKPICFLYEFITKCPQYIPDAVEAFQENFRSLLQDDFPAIALKFLKSENADSTEDAERKDSILMMMNFIACELSKFLFQ